MENDKSIWLKNSENFRKFRTLDTDLKTDVCVIGGGITGISTAYYLCKENMKVTVLEKDKICSKTSGRTTGKITSQHHLFYNYLINSEDKDFAKKYLKANEEAIQKIEEIIQDENIECDFKRKNAYVWTNKLEKLQAIKDEIDSVKSLGRDVKVVDNIEVVGKIEGGIEFKNQAQFNPVKYVNSLANCVLKYGGNIYENSKVVDYKKMDNGFEVLVNVDGNIKKVLTKYLVVATKYPIFNVPGFYFIKMYQELEYGIAIKSDIELDGMYVCSEVPTISYRSYEENGEKYILIVGNSHKTGEKSDNNGFKILEDFAQKYFPDKEIVYKWNAEDCIGLDKIAYIGRYSEVRENMYVATGFKKWGMTTSNIAGRLITDMIMGRKNKYAEIFDSTRIEPVKNREEVKNMLKEAGESIIMPIIKGEKGKKYCAHLGCEVTWNEVTNTWDCPCHGSRYEHDGKLIEGPATKDLEI